MTDFFYEPLIDQEPTDCVLTIGGNPFYVGIPLGAALMEVLDDLGFESGLSRDL